MNPTPNTSSTRVSPHMARLWQMLNILFTIRSFEVKIRQKEENLNKCQEGPLKKEYEGAILTFKGLIAAEEGRYNKLLNEMSMLCVSKDSEPLALPENRCIDYDDDIESRHHRNTCGAQR